MFTLFSKKKQKPSLAIHNDLKINLSKEYKDYCHFADLEISEIEDQPTNFLLARVDSILHPNVGPLGIQEIFLDDAEFMCEYGLKLNFGEYSNATFHKFLAEIYFTMNKFKEALLHTNCAKLFYKNDEEINSYDLEILSTLEWKIYKIKSDESKMSEILREIKRYKSYN